MQLHGTRLGDVKPPHASPEHSGIPYQRLRISSHPQALLNMVDIHVHRIGLKFRDLLADARSIMMGHLCPICAFDAKDQWLRTEILLL